MNLIGRWRIVEMDLWDRKAIELLGPGYIAFRKDGTGSFRFIAVEGWMDCRPVQTDNGPGVEFSWSGNDELDTASGRGTAVLQDDGSLRPRPSCKACRVAYETSRYKTDPGPNKARAAAWYKVNRERGIANARASAEANPERARPSKDKWSAAHPDVRRAVTQRRRVRLRCGEVEKFTDTEIFDRDSWRCGICGQPIDPSFTAPHRMSKSLDHIIPVSRGGSHTRDNVQATHLS